MQKSDEQEGEAQPITTVNFISDYHSIFQKLSYAGISLGEEESFLLTNSLRNSSELLLSLVKYMEVKKTIILLKLLI